LEEECADFSDDSCESFSDQAELNDNNNAQTNIIRKLHSLEEI